MLKESKLVSSRDESWILVQYKVIVSEIIFKKRTKWIKGTQRLYLNIYAHTNITIHLQMYLEDYI